MKQSQLKRTTGLKAKTGFKNKTNSFKTTKKSSFKRKKMEDETPQKILDSIVSKVVRLSYADDEGMVSCFTCGVLLFWKYMQCGHFQDRQHMATRYLPMNLKPQCPDCNCLNDGQNKKFGELLDQRYGQGTANYLIKLANTTIYDFRYEIEILHWSEKLKPLLEKFNNVIQY